jgi:hypothetical protein
MNNSGSTQVLTGGTVTVAGTLSMNGSFAELNLVAAQVLNGTGTLALANGVLNGATTLTDNLSTAITFVHMRDAGTLVLNGATSVSGSGFTMDGGRVVTNAGTVTWTAGTIELNQGAQAGAGTINNLVGATWTDSGTVNKTLRSAFGTVADNALASFNNAGTYIKSGTGTSTVAANFLHTGALTISGGTLAFNTGTGLTNAGTLSIQPGALVSITGGYVQPAAGTLSIDVGGLAITQFGRITVSGAATLNGTLNIALANGFTPALNDRFRFMTFASRSGFFSAQNGLNIGGGLAFQVETSDPLGLELVTVAAAPASASVQSINSANDGSLAYMQRSWVSDFVTDAATVSAEAEDEEFLIALPA